ncbi:nuclear transport factor 2 family protein [Polaribacter sp. M15]
MKRQWLVSLLIIAISLTASSCISTTQKEDSSKKHYNPEDYKNVKNAILDYVDALYLVDSTKIIKSVDTTLRKVGYWYNPDKKQYVNNLEMTHQQLVRLAARWNSDYDQVDETSPKEIEIFDVNSKTASAKLTAEWGIDLFHLAKVDHQWKIVNVIWQSQPKSE